MRPSFCRGDRRRLGVLAQQLTAVFPEKLGNSSAAAAADAEAGNPYFRVSCPAPGWAAIVEGLDVPSALDAQAGGGARAALRRCMLEHPVLCIRNDAPLDRQTYTALASVFGEIQIPEHKVIFKRRQDPSIRPEDVSPLMIMDSGVLGAAGTAGSRTTPEFWHSDDTYMARPGIITTLYAVNLPSKGGDTEFLNVQKAYAALQEQNPKLLAKAEQVATVHSVSNNVLFDDRIRGDNETHYKDDTPRQGGMAALRPDEDTGDWAHAAVRTHPATGVKALYGLCLAGGDMRAVESLSGDKTLPEDEARAFIQEAMAHAERFGEKYTHVWRPHDLILWDNCAVFHQGRNDHPVGEPRLHHKFLLKTMKQSDDPNAPTFSQPMGRRVP